MTTTQNYAIHPDRLASARGALIVALGRDVTWGEFAWICGIAMGTVSNLRNGRSGGTTRTAQKIVEGLRANGVNFTLDQLLMPAELVS